MTNKRVYKFGESKLTLQFGDITKSTAQVLVSSDDFYLTMGGGVSLAILKAGGNSIALDASKKVPASFGDVIVTTAGNLPAQYIFHSITIGPDYSKSSLSKKIIRKLTDKCMQLLNTLNLQSIAFPAIGTGVARFNLELVATEMAESIATYLKTHECCMNVSIYLYDRYGYKTPMDYIRFFEEFASRTPDLEKSKIEVESPKLDGELVSSEIVSMTTKEIKSKRINNIRKLLASLEGQRFKLEEQLINTLNNPCKNNDVALLREKLQENEELRLSYSIELESLSGEKEPKNQGAKSNRNSLTVFLSSTFQDLAEHRMAIKDQISRRDMLFRGMEHFGASPDNLPPAAKIVEEVRKTDVYLGVFGVRYGFIDQATGLSMTELELNEAESSEKPMLLYVIHDEAPIKVSDIESNSEGKTKLDKLKNRIKENYTVYLFRTVEDLSSQVFEDLGKL